MTSGTTGGGSDSPAKWEALLTQSHLVPFFIDVPRTDSLRTIDARAHRRWIDKPVGTSATHMHG